MADERLVDKVHDLSDLELAVLLCLISREHCLISTPSTAIDDLVLELQLVCQQTPQFHACPVLNNFLTNSLFVLYDLDCHENLWPRMGRH